MVARNVVQKHRYCSPKCEKRCTRLGGCNAAITLMWKPSLNWKPALFTLAVVFSTSVVVLPAGAAPAEACIKSQVALAAFLMQQPNQCSVNADCDGYYITADACAQAVVLPKPGISAAKQPQLLKLQNAVRAECGELWAHRPACTPIPFEARCFQSQCVDWRTMHFAPAPSGVAPNTEPALKQKYSYAVVRPDCAPWDGPAITIYLTTKRSAREITAPLLKISLWRNLPPPLNQPISLNSSSQLGVATRCLRLEHCEAALSGTITLTSYTARGGAAGSYELKFKNGEEERGSFRADWQNIVQMCG